MERNLLGINTRCVHAGNHRQDKDPKTLVPPLYQSTSFVFDSVQDGAEKCMSTDYGHCYTRVSNPTNSLLEKQLASLEGAEDCITFASGTAAVSAVLLTALKSGDHCIAEHTLYSSTFYLFSTLLPKFGIKVTFADFSDLQSVESLICPETRLLYCESPANPTLKVIDLPTLARIARRFAVQTVVDSTFASPFVQNPIQDGIDVVVHSTTKYICGHGDAVGGAVLSSTEFIGELREVALKNLGACPAPFNSWLMMRGLKTLSLRMQRHCDNALKIAQWLETQDAVERVFYPGLASHPQHEIASRTMRGYGAIIALNLRGGMQSGIQLMEKVQLCTLAVSVGDTETLVEHPASMTHWYVSPEERQKAGITDGLVRISVGIEDPEDIIADLKQAMTCI